MFAAPVATAFEFSFSVGPKISEGATVKYPLPEPDGVPDAKDGAGDGAPDANDGAPGAKDGTPDAKDGVAEVVVAWPPGICGTGVGDLRGDGATEGTIEGMTDGILEAPMGTWP